VNSPDAREPTPSDAFERRIEQMARALRGRAPDVLASARAAARDLDTSLDAAARALAPTAPAETLAAIRARLADPDAALDLALDAAARAAAPGAPPIPFAELLARARAPDAGRRRSLRRRLLLLRGGPLAAAAALVVMALLLTRGRDAGAATGGPSLLTARQLEAAESAEARLAREADTLAHDVARTAAAATEDGQALLEEIAFLDDAIGECRGALAVNELHPQLRQQLEDLSRQRVDLLRRVDEINRRAPAPAQGGGHG
jgi:hypothetical protein